MQKSPYLERWNSKTHVCGSILLTINWYRYRKSQFTEGYIILEKARRNKPADRIPFSESVFVLSLSWFAGLTFPGNGLTVTCKLNKPFPSRAAFGMCFLTATEIKQKELSHIYIHIFVIFQETTLEGQTFKPLKLKVPDTECRAIGFVLGPTGFQSCFDPICPYYGPIPHFWNGMKVCNVSSVP